MQTTAARSRLPAADTHTSRTQESKRTIGFERDRS
jgi:hypothetical protein